MVGFVPELSETDQEMYDVIFTAALDMREKANQDPIDKWGMAISGLMMAVLNGWERDPKGFPDRVVAEGWNMAYAWWELTSGGVADVPALSDNDL